MECLNGAGIQTKQRLVSVIVDSRREAFDVAKAQGGRLLEVQRQGVRMPFHAAMSMESGNTVVIAPVSEHKVFSDKPPSESRKSAGSRARLYPKAPPTQSLFEGPCPLAEARSLHKSA